MPDKYLRLYAEPEAADSADRLAQRRFAHSLVIPAYREYAELLSELQALAGRTPGLLIILVLNQPDSDSGDANRALRAAVQSLPVLEQGLYALDKDGALLLVERPRPLPRREGVGLARKIGCDIALALHAAGVVDSDWLHNTDADARLPADYFAAAATEHAAVAISHPFRHTLPAQPGLALAVRLYELRLHYYVLGLRAASSPYAFHTLGSCLSARAKAYAGVRGFPRRAGAEDFYLLNKLAKLGPVASPRDPVIELAGRASDRVPFGTGPAVGKLADNPAPLAEPLFYHPHCFTALGALLRSLPDLAGGETVANALAAHPGAADVLEAMGIAGALAHCRTQGRDSAAFSKHFHQWFDGFRTLKFIHGLRARGLDDLDLAGSRRHGDSIWPRDWPFELEQ